MDFQALKNSVASSPAFVLDAAEIVNTLKVLDTLRNQCGCKVLYSIKALPFSSVLELARPFVDGFSVSSLFEARLADEILTGQGSIHLTTPGIRPDEIDDIASLCTHISFNSLNQYQRFGEAARAESSVGLRLNPKLSFLDDDRFDPCRPFSKLGVDIDELCRSNFLDQISGLHFHTVFSATDFTPLIKTIEKLQSHLGAGFTHLKWLNLGGGYLFNRIEDHSRFIDLVRRLKNDFGIDIYIEPGKAVVGQAGHLIATVIDTFASDGKAIAVLDTSINHNPEVFEYQRQPELHEHEPEGAYAAVLAGCTCLAGDIFGEYRFNKPLKMGDRVVFKHVGAYSLIKANRFNGHNLPDVYEASSEKVTLLKRYDYADYRSQWMRNGTVS
ncbi:carboxynorspermidine decarboxylase [Methylobacter sp. sgz302048]|uniref:carboxynorspermidine decarboxylase n=1 Tax=Methylobacter sp. sgz302048 TaxID=3455945 RepID=UPI003F9F4F00